MAEARQVASLANDQSKETRCTLTNLDVLQEKRMDGFWNVDVNRSLSDSWTGFTKLTFVERETFKSFYVIREETDEHSSNHQT